METLATKQHLSSQNPKRKLSKPGTPFGPSSHLRAVRNRTRRGTTDRSYCTHAGPRGAPPPDDAGRKILRPTAARRAGIWPANPTVATPFSHLSFVISGHFFGHFRPPHSSFPPFLDLLNSSTWSFFADFAPFGSYNENEIGQILDRVFRPPQRLLDQGNGSMSSWSLGLSIDMWFVKFGRRLVSFPFLGCFGKLPRSRD